MNFFKDLTIKYLKTNKERTIATIIGLMIAVSMIMTVSMLAESSKKIISDVERSADGNSETIIKNLNKNDVLNLKENIKFKNVAPYVEKDIYSLKTRNNDEKYEAQARLYYIDKKEIEKDPEIYFAKIKEDNVKLKEGSVIVTENVKTSLQEKNLKNKTIKAVKLDGDASTKDIDEIKIDYVTSGNRINYTAIFIIKDFEKEDFLNKEKELGVSLTFKNKTTALKDLEKILKANDLLKENQKVNESENVEYNSYLLLPYDRTNEDNLTKALWIVQIFLFGVIGVATILVIYNSFTISITERRKDYGMLISIGASKKQIKKLVKIEAFIMATLGLIFGFLLGLIGIKILYFMLNKLIKSLITMQANAGFAKMIDIKLEMVFNWAVILTTIIVTYLVTYLGILRPARKASKTSPIESIKGIDEIVIKPKKVKTGFLSKKLFGIEGDLANKSLKRSRGKYRITILSLTVSVVIFLIVHNTLSIGSAETNNLSPDVFKIADYISYGYIDEANKDLKNKNIKDIKNDEYMNELKNTLDNVLEDKKYKDLNKLNILSINNKTILSYDDFNVNEKEKNKYINYIKNAKKRTGTQTEEKEEKIEKFEKENIDKKFSTKLICAEGEVLDNYLKKNKAELKDGEALIVGNFVKNSRNKYYNIKILKNAKKDIDIYSKEDIFDEKNKELKQEYINFSNLKVSKVIDEGFPTAKNMEFQNDLGAVIVNKNTFLKIYKDYIDKKEELDNRYGKNINEYSYNESLKNMSKEEINNKDILKDLKENMKSYYKPSINFNKLYSTKNLNKDDITEFEDYMRANQNNDQNNKNSNITHSKYFENIGMIFASVRAVTIIIKILIYGFIGLIVLISVSNVFNTISTNIILRQREFANLKSMGMTKKQMRKMLDFESILYGIKVIIYGIITSFILLKILETAISKEVSMDINLSIKSILIVIFAVMIIIFTTMRYARSKIDDMNIIDVIKKGTM